MQDTPYPISSHVKEGFRPIKLKFSYLFWISEPEDASQISRLHFTFIRCGRLLIYSVMKGSLPSFPLSSQSVSHLIRRTNKFGTRERKSWTTPAAARARARRQRMILNPLKALFLNMTHAVFRLLGFLWSLSLQWSFKTGVKEMLTWELKVTVMEIFFCVLQRPQVFLHNIMLLIIMPSSASLYQADS